MKVVHVAAGVIRRASDGHVLVAQRGYGSMAGLWEFPGGKIERGESAQETCARELAEELKVTVTDLRACYTVEHDYDDFHLSMECFLCELADDSPQPERNDNQQDLRWVAREALPKLDWMPADVEFVGRLATADADALEGMIKRRHDSRHSMQGNKRADTKPEMLVRRRLRAAGLTGYRLQWKKAPGRPDIAFPGRKVAIFVNGCFWHRCPHCHPSMPKRNTAFWEAKFARNVARDQAALAALDEQGWTAITIWECQLKKDKIDQTMDTVINMVRAAGGAKRA